MELLLAWMLVGVLGWMILDSRRGPHRDQYIVRLRIIKGGMRFF